MAITPVIINMNIDVAGTQEQVTTNTNIRPSTIIFSAPKANTGDIYIGISDVSSTDFIYELQPGESCTLSIDASMGRMGSTGFQLSDFWVDAATAGDDCNVTYWQLVGP